MMFLHFSPGRWLDNNYLRTVDVGLFDNNTALVEV